MDREKVKKGFERCLSGKMPFGCGECPYFGDEEYTDAWSCRLSLMRDSFDLLKEQQQRIEALEIDIDILVKDINTKNCNTCKRQCEIRPEPGEVVRVNCYLWSEKEHT